MKSRQVEGSRKVNVKTNLYRLKSSNYCVHMDRA